MPVSCSRCLWHLILGSCHFNHWLQLNVTILFLCCSVNAIHPLLHFVALCCILSLIKTTRADAKLSYCTDVARYGFMTMLHAPPLEKFVHHWNTSYLTWAVQNTYNHRYVIHKLKYLYGTHTREMKHTFSLSMTRDSECIGWQWCLHLWIVEMNHGTVTFYHIHLWSTPYNLNNLNEQLCHRHNIYWRNMIFN